MDDSKDRKDIELASAQRPIDFMRDSVIAPLARSSRNLIDRVREGLSPEIDSNDLTGPKTAQGLGARLYFWTFIGMVIAPAIAATLYFAFIESNFYQSEARFAVRAVDGEDTKSPSIGGSFSFALPSQNAYVVTSYIRSRAIVDDINQKLDLRAIFTRPEADFLSRLKKDASIDELSRYWSSMVETAVDGTSGIVTVRAYAFRRDDALALMRAIVETSEALVNRMSDRARVDATSQAEKEVRRAYSDFQSHIEKLRQFRNAFTLLDPGLATTEVTKLLAPLMTEKLKLENDLYVSSKEMSSDSTAQRVLQSRISGLNQQIADLRGQLTGEGTKTIATMLAEYEDLNVQRELSERFYTLAQADLDRAHLRASRQSIFFAVFVAPSLPEEARYPERLFNSFFFFSVALIIWGILATIAASIEDHRV